MFEWNVFGYVYCIYIFLLINFDLLYKNVSINGLGNIYLMSLYFYVYFIIGIND